MEQNVEFIDIYVTQNLTAGQFSHTIGRLRTSLADTCTRNRPVLPPVNNDRVRWIDIRLHRNPGTMVRLRLRRDNLYLQGYQMANSQQWLELGNRQRIDGSIPLNIGETYGSMLGSSDYTSMSRVPLGLHALIDATDYLATSTEISERAGALLTIIPMLCESTRFVDILSYIRSIFNRGSGFPNWMWPLVHSWETYSDAVLFYDAHPSYGWVPQQVSTPRGTETAQTVDELLGYLAILQRDPDTIGPPGATGFVDFVLVGPEE